MLLPAALLQACRVPLQRPQRWVALLLALGGAALWWPGLSGLMAASLLHGLAWGVAWAAMLAPRAVLPADAAGAGPVDAVRCLGGGAVPSAASVPAPAVLAGLVMGGVALLTATAVLLLGHAMTQSGPAALVAVHAALAGSGLVGGLVALLGRGRPLLPLANPG